MTQAPANMLPWLLPAWSAYQSRRATERLAHALLLHGPQGTGKSQLARAMLADLLCLEPGGTGACGHCRSCVLLASGAHPDRFFLGPDEGKHVIPIDAVRGVIHSLTFTTTISRRKVALLEPAEAMNRNAANALLKTLEEPPGEAVLILLTHDPARLPITIRSRCQAIGVALPDAAVAARWLVEQEGIGQDQALAALAAAGGSPLRAQQFQQQGLVAQHRQLESGLTGLLRGEFPVPAVLGMAKDVDEDTLWLWLSGFSARLARERVLGRAPAASLTRLQQRADRNRRLVRTSVRGDLLLRDWLIEWTR